MFTYVFRSSLSVRKIIDPTKPDFVKYFNETSYWYGKFYTLKTFMIIIVKIISQNNEIKHYVHYTVTDTGIHYYGWIMKNHLIL